MAIKANYPLVILFFSLIFVFSTLAFATQDADNDKSPSKKLSECQSRCEQERRQPEERAECRRQCLEEFRREHEGQGGGDNKREPEKCKKECQKQTESREGQRRCVERCEREYRGREGEGNERYEGGREEEREEHSFEGEKGEGKPYLFEDQHFTTRVETDHGRVRVLQRFDERSKLLRGLENIRLAILEADPQTFVMPNHRDAETVFFVAEGRGTISLVRQDKRESFNLKCGDILTIPVGTTVYLINRSNNEKLIIVKLLQPVSTPGHFETFFGPGGEDPESYYKAFSTELLEAALGTKRDKFQRIFEQQKQGVIIKASQEQIKAMSHHEEGGIWPFGGETKGPFNIFNKRASQSNQYGQLYEAGPNDSRELQQLDFGIGFANITEGAMTAPYYNSRATKIAVVTNGEGFFEMACPHLASSSESIQGGGGSHSQRKSGPSYQKVRGNLRRGSVFVVPAGHPVTTVASQNQNLQLLCFYINAQNNEKFPLAGRRNIVNQMESEAKELAFGVPAREVDEVFKSQEEEFFFRGPHQQQYKGGEGRAVA